MPARRLLVFDGSQMRAWLATAGTLAAEGAFSGDKAGIELFRAYLKANIRSHFRVLVDTPDEGFQLETVPRVQGSDRAALVARKLNQHFYGTPFATAVSLGRERTGRRDERLLFLALTRPAALEPWMNALRDEGAQCAGIYTPPLIAPLLLKRIGIVAPSCVLVYTGQDGIRQIFFDQGHARFSRLTPLTETAPQEVARTCVGETAKLYQYLAGQRMISRKAPLATLLMIHDQDAPAFLEQCRSTDEMRFQIMDLNDAARRCGLKGKLRDSCADPLLLHLLAAGSPPTQFAPRSARRYYRLWQTRTAMLGAGAATLTACLAFSASHLLDMHSLRNEHDMLRLQEAADTKRYEAALKALPPLPTSVENLRALTDRYEQLEKRSPPVRNMYMLVSQALESFPKIDLERIEWSAGGPGESQGQDSRARQANGKEEQAGGGEEATLHGQLPVAMLGDQRAMLATINGFAEALAASGRVQVSIARMPFDIESGKSIKGGGEDLAKAEPPRFVIRLTRSL